ncbi:MAG: four helix bundle protein [Candidatus Moranbacteria bacterium]|nr:four helix bundle protein [Candidatus Moranbacteria bacterium]
MKYDLEDRTRKFSKEVIQFLLKIKKHRINDSMISQLIRSATSVGANYCEANGASSKKDFNNKIFICRKEIQETEYWLEMLAASNPEEKETLKVLWKEAHELTLIFNKISTTIRENKIVKLEH